MSATTETTDSVNDETSYQQAFDAVMRKLPERFQEHSQKYSGKDKDIIVSPISNWMKSESTESTLRMTQSEYRIIEGEGFEKTFVAWCDGRPEFWFEYTG